MVGSSTSYSTFGEVVVARTAVYVHPAFGTDESEYFDVFPSVLKGRPFLEFEEGVKGPSIRFGEGIRVEGARCDFTPSGAVLFPGTLENTSALVLAAGAYQCTFERSSAFEFSRRIVLFGSVVRRFQFYRKLAPIEFALSVDDVVDGSARARLTILALLRNSIVATSVAAGGLATFAAQYPAAKEGMQEMIRDAGLIARLLDPVERQMTDTNGR